MSQSTRTGLRAGAAAAWCGVSMCAAAHAAQDVDQAAAATASAAACGGVALTCADGDKVIYLPAFFSQYNPITALDLVNRVPGFSIDPGDNVRGFGGAAGNVLIDGQRPSTKSADIFEILSRIGLGAVEKIELIRGGTGGLDVGGQAVVVNVVRKSGEGAKASIPWRFALVKRRPNGGLRPQAEISYAGKAGDFSYTAGANVFGISLTFGGEEEITRFFEEDEFRTRDGVFREQGGGVNFKVERPFENGDTARFSVEAEYLRFREDFDETRFLPVGGPDLALFTFPLDELEFEIGADYEHGFTENFGAKIIALFGREFESFDSGFEFLPADGDSEQSIFFSDQNEGEIIGRMEFDWKGWNKHSIQFGSEIARNFIDSEAELVATNDMGVLEPVNIDGANTRVSELRNETFISDSWKVAPKLTIDANFALELSRIAQSGDNANSRFFVYPKPSVTFTYAPAEKVQWRLSAERIVNQLSFGQFVSSVNFDDEDVDFGNPDLQPQRTWRVEASYERRFGEFGVVELIGFFNYVQDVEDLLPIGGIVEVPGNIGDGQIYGGRINLTAPLDWMGLKNSRFEGSLTQRESSITDPVTGEDRLFSFTPKRFWNVDFRQDFTKAKISWGFFARNRTDSFGFGLDELSVFKTQPDIGAFIETTAIKGVRTRFQVNDITNVTDIRERTVFDGSRADNPALFRERRSNNNGGAFRLTFSGNL
ncbi:MAG: TonB-dependent receptor [Pseudomonadota bacterium]